MIPEVKAAFEAMPMPARQGCMTLRELIFEVAAQTREAGQISEELRWGQPAYLTQETKSGTTIRLGRGKPNGFALLVHCQTSLIEDFRPLAPEGTRFDGSRAVLFADVSDVDKSAMRLLIHSALTYHL